MWEELEEIQTISVKKIIDSLRDYYANNIEESIEKLKKVLDEKTSLRNRRSIVFRKETIDGNECLILNIKMEYKYKIYKLCVCKRNNIFFLISKDFSHEEKEAILSSYDFTKLYDYYINENYSNKTVTLNGYYDINTKSENNNKPNQIQIVIKGNKYVRIGNENYGRTFYIKGYDEDTDCDEYSSELSDEEYNKAAYKLSYYFATDKNFLDNVKIYYIELPDWVKKQIEKTKKTKAKRLIKKIRNLFKREED